LAGQTAPRFYDANTHSNGVIGGISLEYCPGISPFSYKDMPNHIFSSFTSMAWNKLYRNEMVKKNRLWFQEIRRVNDLYFSYTSLVCAKKISLLPEPLRFYRIRQGGNAATTHYKEPLAIHIAFMGLKEKLQSLGIYKEVEKSYLHTKIDTCLWSLYSKRVEYSAYEALYSAFQTEDFSDIDSLENAVNYFHNTDNYHEAQRIRISSLSEHLFRRINIILTESENLRSDRDRIEAEVNQISHALLEKETMLSVREAEINQIGHALLEKEALLSATETDLHNIRASRSYHAGRALLWLPRKMRSLLRRITNSV
jgi:hypothetical protein